MINLIKYSKAFKDLFIVSGGDFIHQQFSSGETENMKFIIIGILSIIIWV